ncbi:MAG: hypothetical protein PVI06_18355 [Desulfobacterales bacterium]|jgi:hypothetical protein
MDTKEKISWIAACGTGSQHLKSVIPDAFTGGERDPESNDRRRK